MDPNVPPTPSAKPVQTPQSSPPTSQPISSPTIQPVVLSSEPEKPQGNYLLIGIAVFLLLFGLIGIIAVKVYQPNLFKIPSFNNQAELTPPPSPIQVVVSASATPKSVNSTVKVAFENAQNIMNQVDLNNNSLYKSSLYYAYLAKVVTLNKDSNNLLEITTDRTIPGLPLTWKYNNLTKTFIVGDDDILRKGDPSQLKVGSSIQVNGSFIISTKNDIEIPGTFNLDNIVVLHDSHTLSTPVDPPLISSALPINNGKPTYPIKDPIIKDAFEKSKKTMTQIDLNIDEVDSGLLYMYEGKITEISKLSDESLQITTDTHVPGIPNIWNVNNNSVVFQLSKQDRMDKSNLKIGDNVRIAALFIIQTNKQFYSQNQFVLSSISLLD